jgi:transcriptional antiterminator RfaH
MDVSVAFHRTHPLAHLAPWYVVQHKPNAEAVAIRNLERQSINVFAPFEMGKRRFGNKTREVRKALFPGYVFVHFDPGSFRWHTVNSTFGVSRIVSFGSEGPAPVPGNLMLDLMARCDFNGCLLPPSHFEPGEDVRIRSGAFADFIATVEKMGPQQRVWLLLDIMGRSTRVTVDAAALTRIRA